MPVQPPDTDTAVNDELAAIRRIARAYAALSDLDDATHERVLRWAADKFHGDAATL